MNIPPNDRLEEIFAQAAALPEGERAAWLEGACAGEPKLREQVELLVRSHQAAGFMEGVIQSPEIATELARLKPEGAGDWIDQYKLIEQIGEGGFGTVWLAEQQRPVQRQVALKIIKIGMDTREVIARFEQERQALAVMDHPSIAKVFDAGSTQFGRPYFAMELVQGARITKYCDEAGMGVKERLELFVAVCQAVQHAHQKGIIHRDLKPSNILVTLHQGVAVPKVIDFGVAKATQQRQPLTDLTIYTQFEQLIGTPLYMSPEQAEMSGLDIDTRSDIYSLGVLLYELLAGRTPFDPEELMRQGLDEIRRTIREREPQRPSTAVQTMALDARINVAHRRQLDPAKLFKLIRGDLDWIVMKALEKDRTRRYEAAIEFAKDIQRHLSDEPVLARPPTQFYRLRRLMRRNRLAFAAVTAVAAALVIGLSVAIYSLGNARMSAEKAAASESKATHLMYASDMRLAQQALRANNVGLARDLLDRHRPVSGKRDLRGWEWRYLYQESRSAAQAMLTKRKGVPVFSASYSPDRTLLLLGYSDGVVELWDLAARKKYREFLPSAPGQSARAVFSPLGESFAAVLGSRAVKTVNIKTGAEKILCKVKGSVRDLSYSRDGEWIAVVSRLPDQVTVLRSTGGAPVMSYPLPVGGGVFFNNARISQDKARLYVSCGAFDDDNPTVRCLSVPDGNVLWEHSIGLIDESAPDLGSDVGFSAMDLSPDGKSLAVATGYRDPKIRVLDTGKGEVRKRLQGHTNYVLQLAFSGDGRVLASSSEDQTIRLWNTATWGEILPPLRGHNHEVNGITISEDGRFLASGNKDGEVLLWDSKTPPPGRGRRDFPSHIRRVIPLPVQRIVLGESVDQQWMLLDLLTSAEEPLPASELAVDGSHPRFAPKKYPRKGPRLDSARLGLRGTGLTSAISPDGRLLVVASEHGEIGFYDASNLNTIEIVRSNLPSVFGLAFSPDGGRLVMCTGGDDGILLWDVALRQEVLRLSSNRSILTGVEFVDDGNTLIVNTTPSPRSKKGACQYWRAPSFQEIDDAEHRTGPWPHMDAFAAVAAPPTLAELKGFMEAHYRATLARRQTDSRDYIDRRGAIENLAELFSQQKRYAEAEPLLRELLESLKQGSPQDETVVFATTKRLLSVMLARMQVEPQGPQASTQAHDAKQADALVDELLAILTRRSISAPEQTLETLKLAVFQIWLGRKSQHIATYRRMMEWAQRKPDQGDPNEHAALAWSLDPTADPALQAHSLSLAQKAAALAETEWHQAWYYKALALANYRSRYYAESEDALNRAEPLSQHFKDWQLDYKQHFHLNVRFLRSMLLCQSGKAQQARELFAQAELEMKPLPVDPRQVFESASAFDDIMVWLAYKEARELLLEDAAIVPLKQR